MTAPRPEQLSLSAELRPLIADLISHRAWIYWFDFLTSMLVFVCAMSIAIQVFLGGWIRLVAFVVGAMALYRASVFMHEIVHIPSGQMTGFRFGWNLLCGVPILLPSFLYYSHLNHHAQPLYATRRDPEYLPFAIHPVRSWLILLAGTLCTIPLLWWRFAVLVPLSWMSPPCASG